MEREPRTVGLKPDAQLLVAAAFELAAQLVDGGQSGMSQPIDMPQRILEDCLHGKAAELAYARIRGLDPRLIRADRRSRPDFVIGDRAVDVKVARNDRVTLAAGSWARMLDRPGTYAIAAVAVYPISWSAQLLGELDRDQLARAIERNQIQRYPGKRPGSSSWYSIPLDLFAREGGAR